MATARVGVRTQASRRTEPGELSAEKARLVEEHLGLATSIARKWTSRCRGGIEPCDIEQAAFVGLIEAARRFDPRRDCRFAAFASLRIRGAIGDYLRAHDPLSRRRRHDVRELESAARGLQADVKRAPTPEELCRSLGWDAERLRAAAEDTDALKTGWAQVQEADVEKLDAECPQPSPLQALMEDEARQRLVEEVRALPEREAMILSLHYFEDLPFKDIAAILGVTDSRVSQLHSAALARLRRAASLRLVPARGEDWHRTESMACSSTVRPG